MSLFGTCKRCYVCAIMKIHFMHASVGMIPYREKHIWYNWFGVFL